MRRDVHRRTPATLDERHSRHGWRRRPRAGGRENLLRTKRCDSRQAVIALPTTLAWL